MAFYLDHSGPIAFAHRGGARERPENTMAAFAHAVALGYRYVETDVRATRDGVCVLVHDPTLDPASGVAGAVASLTFHEVRSAVIGGEPVARLDELLGAWPNLRINIDVKADDAVAPLVRQLRNRDASQRVCLGAFSDRRLFQLRAAMGPEVCTSMGPNQVRLLRLAASRLAPRRLVPRSALCVQVPPTWRRIRVVDRAFVQTAHDLGMPVHVWTVNDVGEMQRLLDLGVDGLMSDAVTALRDVLQARGQWSRG